LAAADVYQRFVAELAFADGVSTSFGGLLDDVTVVFGQDRVDFAVPSVWEMAFNDFTGPLPAEMQMIRHGDGGPTKGLLWLHVVEVDQPADLEEVGARFVTQYFQNVHDDQVTFDVIENKVDDDEPELEARVLRIDVGDIGDIEASVIWHDGRLYVLGLWQNFEPPTDRAQFFTRLPAQSSFVMMKNALVRSFQ
jgi:hypothetical protein